MDEFSIANQFCGPIDKKVLPPTGDDIKILEYIKKSNAERLFSPKYMLEWRLGDVVLVALPCNPAEKRWCIIEHELTSADKIIEQLNL